MIGTEVKKEVKNKKKVERKAKTSVKAETTKKNDITINIDNNKSNEVKVESKATKSKAKEVTETKSTKPKSKKTTETKVTKSKTKKTTTPKVAIKEEVETNIEKTVEAKAKTNIENKEANIAVKNKENIIVNSKGNIKEVKVISEMDEYLFHEGKHTQCYEFMGAHFTSENRKKGVRFTTWAPRASKIVVIGDFSGWEVRDEFTMERVNDTGLWSVFIPGLEEGMKYKFAITNQWGSWVTYKADPYAFKAELRPDTASVLVKENKYKWGDKKWITKRSKTNPLEAPMNTYELHLGSWKTKNGEFMTYEEIAEVLPKYVKEMGYTHVELMPVNEHPFDASWGYQATGYYSASARFGDLKGLKDLVNNLHKEDIGVILDWVPGHFCKDEHGLINFDGTPTYEYQAGWKSDNKGWGTNNFDLGRPEVKSFLISNAMYWINEFHIDGLRVDAVSNILYLDYGRNHGEWEPNCYGDRGNLEGIQFIKDLNHSIREYTPGVITVAEESTSWPGITAPVEDGGLGFTFKWNMGWMNDTLRYVKLDPIYRKYHHNLLNFSMMYHYSEKFVLPISHDEVVHGKGSLINKMHGDDWNKYAGLRMYAAYMMAHPGKKLLFMGSEFGQFIEWREYEELQWHVIDQYEIHKKTHDYFKALNHFYKENKALWELDYEQQGFQWIDADNADQSILTFIRRGKKEDDTLIFICNFTPVVYYDFKLGVPEAGKYVEVFNTDGIEYGGSNQRIIGELHTEEGLCHDQPHHVYIKVPPKSVLVLKKKNK